MSIAIGELNEKTSCEVCDVPREAILQKDGESYAIVPSTPTGLASPEILRKVADVAEKYGVLVKLTNAQRIAMVGFKKDNIHPAIG